MIYLFIVFILGFIISNIPAYPMLYPPVLVQMMFIFPIVYLSLIRFLRNRPSNCFTYIEVTFSIDILSGIFLFYTLTNFILSIRNSFLLTGAKYISNELTTSLSCTCHCIHVLRSNWKAFSCNCICSNSRLFICQLLFFRLGK